MSQSNGSEPVTEPLTVADIVALLQAAAPPELAEDWDSNGLICGDPAEPVRTVLLAVDPLTAVVDEAIGRGVDMVITHHPLYLRGTDHVAATDPKGRCVHRLIRAGIALLYPLILLITAFALGSLDEAIANNDGDLAMQSLSVLIGITTVFGVVLTGLTLGVISCFKGGDRWLPKDAKVTHRDIASARFLHVAQNPARRAMGRVRAACAPRRNATGRSRPTGQYCRKSPDSLPVLFPVPATGGNT